MKRLPIVLLTLTFFSSFILSGCAVSNDWHIANGEYNDSTPVIPFDSGRSAEIGPRPIFDVPPREKAEELFSELIAPLYRVAAYKNGIYTFATATNNLDAEKQFYYCNLDDGSITQWSSISADFQVHNFTAFSDGSLLVAGYSAQYDENGSLMQIDDSMKIYHLRENDAQLLIIFEDSEALGVMNSLAINEIDGYIYLLTNDFTGTNSYFPAIRVYSMHGKLLFSLETEAYVNDIFYSKNDGTLYVMIPEYADAQSASTDPNELDMIISTLDADKKELKEVMRIPGGANARIYINQTEVLAELKNNTIWKLDYEKRTLTELFDLSKHGISGWITFLSEHKGRFVAFADNGGMGLKFIRFSIIDDYSGSVETLRLAKFEGFRDFFLDEMIADFNFYNPQYYVEVIDYSLYGSQATSHLHTDIIKGEAPDILLLSAPLMQDTYMPIYQYTASGLLADLEPYMARDLNSDDYWTAAIHSLHTDSGVYIAVPSFSIFGGIVGHSSAIESLDFKHASDFFEFIRNDFKETTQQFAIHMTNEQLVSEMVSLNTIAFIEFESNTANFNSDCFITLLEAASALVPTDEPSTSSIPDMISIARGDSQMAFLAMRHFGDLDMFAHVLHGDFKTIGFPNSKPTGGVAMIPQYIFAISSNSRHMEGAWAFLRMIYEYEQIYNLTGINFPMNKAAFNALSKQYVELQERYIIDGGSLYIADPEGDVLVPPIQIDTITEIVSQTEKMVNNIDRLYLMDSSILNLIYDELPAFFAGINSAEETAQIIQNRVQTYLWEVKQ